MRRIKVGDIYGQLTVIQTSVRTDGKHVYHLCQCTCGKQCERRSDNLKDTSSCGCTYTNTKKNGEQKNKQKKIKIGDKFGKLTIIQLNVTRIGNHSYHLCQCECGNFCTRRGDSLKNTSDCGCKNSKSTLQKDKINDKYDLLTIINSYIYNDGKHSWHKCKCDCGNVVEVRADQLRVGNTKSCGCINSYGELYIRNFLTEQKIDYKQQYFFDDLRGEKNGLLRFDFAIINKEEIKLLIEYNGKQHYEPRIQFGGEERYITQQKYDNLKIEYCEKNNIPLLIIPYWDFNNIENLILEKLKEVN